MSRIEKTGVGYAVSDWETSIVRLDGEAFSITKIAKLAGVEAIGEGEENVFDHEALPLGEDGDEADGYPERHNAEMAAGRAAYAAARGRPHPRVYRFRVVVEAEELPEAEAAAFWEAQRAPKPADGAP